MLGSDRADHLVCQAHFKLPGDGTFFPWHQDATHRGNGDPAQWEDCNGRGSYVQTLTAVDAVTLLNGPVEFLRGSHRGGHLRLPYREGVQTEDPRLEALREQGRQCPALMAPGDVAVFGPYVVHGSQPNESDQPRRAFVNGFAFPGANRKLYPGHAAGAGEAVDLLPPARETGSGGRSRSRSRSRSWRGLKGEEGSGRTEEFLAR